MIHTKRLHYSPNWYVPLTHTRYKKTYRVCSRFSSVDYPSAITHLIDELGKVNGVRSSTSSPSPAQGRPSMMRWRPVHPPGAAAAVSPPPPPPRPAEESTRIAKDRYPSQGRNNLLPSRRGGAGVCSPPGDPPLKAFRDANPVPFLRMGCGNNAVLSSVAAAAAGAALCSSSSYYCCGGRPRPLHGKTKLVPARRRGGCVPPPGSPSLGDFKCSISIPYNGLRWQDSG